MQLLKWKLFSPVSPHCKLFCCCFHSIFLSVCGLQHCVWLIKFRNIPNWSKVFEKQIELIEKLQRQRQQEMAAKCCMRQLYFKTCRRDALRLTCNVLIYATCGAVIDWLDSVPQFLPLLPLLSSALAIYGHSTCKRPSKVFPARLICGYKTFLRFSLATHFAQLNLGNASELAPLMWQ